MDPVANEESDAAVAQPVGDGDNLGTFLEFLLLLLCNMTGSGIFYLGLTSPGNGTEVANYALAFIACCASLNSFISLMQLMDAYDKGNYLDLVETMTSRTCAKLMALLFLIARVGSLVAIISTLEWKMLELSSIIKLEHEPNGGLVMALAVACVAFVESCAYVGTGCPLHQTVHNVTNIVNSTIGTLNVNAPNTANRSDQNKKRSAVAELGIRKILIFVLLSTYFAFTAIYVFHWIRIVIAGPKLSALDNQEEKVNWFATPVIVFATSSFAVVHEFPRKIRRCVSNSRTNFVRMTLFLVLFLLPTAYTVLSCFYRPGTVADPYLSKIQGVVCILTIGICSLAASLRLEACSSVFSKILEGDVMEGSSHIIFTNGGILAISLFASFLVGDAERVIVFFGSTVYPFLHWFVPNLLCVLHYWRAHARMYTIFPSVVMVLTVAFIATHMIALHSAELPSTYYRYSGRY